jgi:hypothetical protein
MRHLPVLLLPGAVLTAAAQERGTPPPGPPAAPPAQERQGGEQPPHGLVIQGELLDTMKVQLKGIGQTHTLIKLRSPEGKVAVVDLGSEVPSGLALEKGSRLSVQGLPARINDRPVVVARRVIQMPREPRERGQR